MAPAFSSQESRHRRFLAVVLVIAAAARIAAWWGLGEQLREDPDAYRVLAISIHEQGVFGFPDPSGKARPTAFRPPGYPWILSWLVTDGVLPESRIAWLHGLLGLLTVGMVYGLARKLWDMENAPRSAWVPFLAALLVAVDPILLVQSTKVMTETAATFASVAAWWGWYMAWRAVEPKSQIGWGAVLGLLLLMGFCLRPISIVWSVLLGLYLLLRGGGMTRLRTIVAMTACFACGVGAWMYRNWSELGSPIWATSHGGYTLLLANNPDLYDHWKSGWFPGPWNPERFFRAWDARGAGDLKDPAFWSQPPAPQPIRGNELTDNALADAAAKAAIAREPGLFVYGCFVRVAWLWSPLPQEGHATQRWLVGIWYGLVYLAVAVSIVYQWKWLWSAPWIAGWLLALALTATHAVYWSNLRMRAPAIPVVAIMAAGAFIGKANRLRLTDLKNGPRIEA